ncbi:MAG: molybdopterin-dependent oxidoreductase [Lachnospiraceae bacterium]|nr:molybdopterin-dependent oxidoreductase [Lachnospiraceae bacterium]
METTRTGICGLCGGECIIDAHMRDGKIVSVEGNKDFPGSNGKICVKGAALKQQIYHPDRLLYPMKRKGDRGSGEFERISWEEALDTIAERMRETKEKYSADETVVYVGHPKWFRPQIAEFCRKYGTCSYGTESSTCAYALIMAFQACCGIPSFPIPDFRNADTLLMWGINPFHSQIPGSGRLVKLKKAGKTLIVADPRCTPLTEIADVHLKLLPGTDGALALAIAHVILEENLQDTDFIRENTAGFEEYREYVREFTPEKAEKITTVPAEMIKRAARLIAAGRCALQMSASPAVHNINGFQNSRAVILLMALTGNFGRPGGIMAPGPKPLSLRGGFRPGINAAAHIERCHSHDKFPLWSQLVGETQMVELSRYISGEGKYPVRNLIAFGLNTHMWPRPDLLSESFRHLEFFVNMDAFMTEACRYADIVLPCELDLEREQVRIVGGNHVFCQQKIVEQGDMRNDLEVILALAGRLGIEICDPPIRTMDDYINMQLAGTGYTASELREAGKPLPVRAEEPAAGPGKPGSHAKFPTPSGKIEFVSGILPEGEGLPLYRDYRETLPMKEYPLILATGIRKPQLFHSRAHRLPWLANLEAAPAIDIHPKQAEALGLMDGEAAVIETPVGQLEMPVRFDSSLPAGMVSVYHGAIEKDINYLIDLDYRDPYTGFPGYKSYCCRIRRAGQ